MQELVDVISVEVQSGYRLLLQFENVASVSEGGSVHFSSVRNSHVAHAERLPARFMTM